MTNEAAERLRVMADDEDAETRAEMLTLIPAALAAERKATVERIRELGDQPELMFVLDDGTRVLEWTAFNALLDAEAAL